VTAATNDNLCRLLLDHGADVNQPSPLYDRSGTLQGKISAQLLPPPLALVTPLWRLMSHFDNTEVRYRILKLLLRRSDIEVDARPLSLPQDSKSLSEYTSLHDNNDAAAFLGTTYKSNIIQLQFGHSLTTPLSMTISKPSIRSDWSIKAALELIRAGATPNVMCYMDSEMYFQSFRHDPTTEVHARHTTTSVRSLLQYLMSGRMVTASWCALVRLLIEGGVDMHEPFGRTVSGKDDAAGGWPVWVPGTSVTLHGLLTSYRSEVNTYLGETSGNEIETLKTQMMSSLSTWRAAYAKRCAQQHRLADQIYDLMIETPTLTTKQPTPHSLEPGQEEYLIASSSNSTSMCHALWHIGALRALIVSFM
jgi:hypothetical protein